MSLFRADIEPRCAYCWHGTPLKREDLVGCARHGVMAGTDHCRSFLYDPFKRVPPKPAKLRKEYTESDFQI